MAKGLLDLAASMERKAKAIDAAASQLAVETAQTIVGDLAFKTPVDTSQALSNWIVTLDAPSTGKIKPHFPGEGGSSQKSSAGETINQARAVLAKKKPGQKIYITNNLPYIRRLNDGYSKQAPAGFVERSVLIGRKMRKNFKIKG
jgi:hypothetical protein